MLGYYSYNQSKSFLRNQAMQSLKATTEKTSYDLSIKMKYYNDLISYIAYNTKLQQMFSNNYMSITALSEDLRFYLNPLFNNMLATNTGITNITIYSKSTMPEYGTFIMPYERVQDDLWYDDCMDSYYANWYYDKEKQLFIAKKFVDIYSDRVLGILKIGVNYNRFFDVLARGQFNEYGILVMDNQGVIIANVNQGKKVDSSEIVNKQEGLVYLSGIENILIRSEIPDTNWTMYYYVPTKLITTDAGKILKTTLLTVTICILILVLIVCLLSDSFSKRINLLIKKIQIVENGFFDVNIQSDYNDEIGLLTNRFGRMVEKIHRLTEEVYKSNLLQKEAELKALQAQINPHFLYNTLSVINWKAITVGADDISYIASTLSIFYRTSLNRGETLISIKDEIENIKAYIGIQLIMHDYAFDIIYDIDNEIYNFFILNLTLQPVVENAIEHGIDQKRKGKGLLRINGYLENEDIHIIISDNGLGICQDTVNLILSQNTKGYGLRNVNDRIKLFFGEQYGITMRSRINQGTIVEIIIPKHQKYED